MTHTQYERPTTVAQAVGLLSPEAGRTALLAGGTDLMIKMRSGLLHPDVIVDVKKIPELCQIRWTAEGELHLGAAVTMRQLFEDDRISKIYPALSQGAWAVGSLQTRMRATVGGNLCNASPCMDTAPALLLTQAGVVAASRRGTRQIALTDFFVGVTQTALLPDELATEIVVPASSQLLKTAFDKIKRVRGHDLALVNAAVAHDPKAKTLCAAIGSCGATPLVTERIPDVEIGKSDPAAVGEKLAQVAVRAACPIDDVRASAEYRRDMTALLVRRLTARLLAGGCSCGWQA